MQRFSRATTEEQHLERKTNLFAGSTLVIIQKFPTLFNLSLAGCVALLRSPGIPVGGKLTLLI